MVRETSESNWLSLESVRYYLLFYHKLRWINSCTLGARLNCVNDSERVSSERYRTVDCRSFATTFLTTYAIRTPRKIGSRRFCATTWFLKGTPSAKEFATFLRICMKSFFWHRQHWKLLACAQVETYSMCQYNDTFRLFFCRRIRKVMWVDSWIDDAVVKLISVNARGLLYNALKPAFGIWGSKSKVSFFIYILAQYYGMFITKYDNFSIQSADWWMWLFPTGFLKCA